MWGRILRQYSSLPLSNAALTPGAASQSAALSCSRGRLHRCSLELPLLKPLTRMSLQRWSSLPVVRRMPCQPILVTAPVKIRTNDPINDDSLAGWPTAHSRRRSTKNVPYVHFIHNTYLKLIARDHKQGVGQGPRRAELAALSHHLSLSLFLPQNTRLSVLPTKPRSQKGRHNLRVRMAY